MGFAKSSSSTLFAGKSVAEGTPPAGNYRTITPTAHSVEPSAGSFQAEDIDPSGKGLDIFRTSTAGRGDVNAHWRPTIFDQFAECVLQGAFGAALNLAAQTLDFDAVAAGVQQINGIS